MKELRHHIRLLFCLCIGMIFSCAQIWGQDESNSFVDEMHLLEIESRMLSFYQELKDISARVGQYTSNEQLTEASQKVTTIDAKWNTYYQSRQIEIAEDDSLLQIVADYQLTKQNLLDSIAIQKHFFDAQKNFADAEVFFQTQDSTYAKLYKTAVEYSLLKTLAAELEKVKGKEQLLFSEIQSHYDIAKNLSEEFKDLLPRFQSIEEKYIELKNISDKIQALEYKPWLQRIKDYLYSLAAVAMILLFLNMLQAKLKVLKQARENAKKLREMMDKDNNDYPTI
ncbi:hypothetical protein [Mediterranea massiliensis]|uniref:hypothetical protein n=1 Tax=Mediterranea massiliensis TaxID=1841865 RepID=UPI001114ED3A|nr:hypothetical protein [Mediterranea massiliensis]